MTPQPAINITIKKSKRDFIFLTTPPASQAPRHHWRGIYTNIPASAGMTARCAVLLPLPRQPSAATPSPAKGTFVRLYQAKGNLLYADGFAV
ncbi:MAG: hypothetical protein LBB23_00250 [Rickettsiales bacterium]|nr:hypothetical protein [Rickettsiales bacterium]